MVLTQYSSYTEQGTCLILHTHPLNTQTRDCRHLRDPYFIRKINYKEMEPEITVIKSLKWDLNLCSIRLQELTLNHHALLP
jgi:hypothetical protein